LVFILCQQKNWGGGAYDQKQNVLPPWESNPQPFAP
jgi:hypothetical protein